MSDASEGAPVHETTPGPPPVRRLEQRVERERKARLEAEAIAERSLRHLYQQQARLQLLQAVTAAANEAETLEDAIGTTLEAVCTHTGWSLGHAYLCQGERLLPAPLWRCEDLDRFETFRTITEQAVFGPGEGLPGQVFAAGRPAWIRDVTQDESFIRVRLATDLGVRGAFGFPVRVGEEVVAVLEFFSPRPEEPDEKLLETMGAVGVQLGRVVERQRAHDELERRERLLREAQQIARLGSWEWTVVTDRIWWSDELYRIFGLSPESFDASFEGYLARIHPEDRDRLRRTIEAAYASHQPYEVTHRVVHPDGSVRHVHSRGEVVVGPDGQPAAFRGTALDVTEQKESEAALQAYAARLARSNEELQRFAYVASHDLQEPLRMVTSFLQLLQHRYEGHIDEKADEYIGYAVDGARRMQQLIRDLLEYSRVESRGRAFAPVDCEAVLDAALANLDVALRESGAEVSRDPLPTVVGDQGQLVQLFQNLIANAVKFRSEASLRIHVSASRAGSAWRFCVSDNGIGLDPKHTDRIFQIFQRLHTRDVYEGTGIGLAICKKVVERHGGRIWVDAAPGLGATFYFTLPKDGPPQEPGGTVLAQ